MADVDLVPLNEAYRDAIAAGRELTQNMKNWNGVIQNDGQLGDAAAANTLDEIAVGDAAAVRAAIGVGQLKEAVDANNATDPNVIYTGPGNNPDAANWPDGGTYGNIIVFKRNSDIRQICVSNSGENNALMWIRSTYAGVFSDYWTPIYTLTNIVGSVSQNSGKPTGAIFESTGRYTKYADGTLVIHGSATLTYNSASFLTATFQLPTTFVDLDLRGSATYNQSPSLDKAKLGKSTAYIRKNNLSAGFTSMEVGMVSDSAFSSGDTAGIDVVLHGRWF